MDSLVNDDAAAAAAAMTREDDATAAIDGAETRETGDGGDVDATARGRSAETADESE